MEALAKVVANAGNATSPRHLYEMDAIGSRCGSVRGLWAARRNGINIPGR